MKNKIKSNAFLLFLLFFISSLISNNPLKGESKMELISPVFKHNEMIPKKYTCQGKDINPQLNITGVPEGTKSLALIVDDPDAPMGTWVHWVVYNIPILNKILRSAFFGIRYVAK